MNEESTSTNTVSAGKRIWFIFEKYDIPTTTSLLDLDYSGRPHDSCQHVSFYGERDDTCGLNIYPDVIILLLLWEVSLPSLKFSLRV